MTIFMNLVINDEVRSVKVTGISHAIVRYNDV